MINSLSKDSHINRYCRSQNQSSAPYNIRVSSDSLNSKISATKSDQVSFKGKVNLFPQLANSNEMKELYNSAKAVVGEKHSDVVDLIKYTVDSLLPKVGESESKVQGQASKPSTKNPEIMNKIPDLLKTSKDSISEMIATLQKKILDDNKLKVTDKANPDGPLIHYVKTMKDANGNVTKVPQYKLSEKERRDEVIKIITDSADVQPEMSKDNKFLKNKMLEKFLFKAYENNVAFSAAFALGLTCLLRPASIMMLPGDKKNADDQKYAAAHSIASGVIGYIISTIVSTPVAKALSKVLDNPQKYMSDKIPNYNPAKVSNAEVLEVSKKTNDCAKTWITRGVDISMSIPKAIITVALIPPILKYVFGWEKKKKKPDPNACATAPQPANLNIVNDSRTQKFQESMGVSK